MGAGETDPAAGCERFALIVSLEIEGTEAAAFRPMLDANAADSLRLEPGCLRFDVLASEDGAAPQVVLYEIYTDRAAFDRHLAMPHYREFDQRTRPMIRHKTVRFFTLREQPAGRDASPR